MTYLYNQEFKKNINASIKKDQILIICFSTIFLILISLLFVFHKKISLVIFVIMGTIISTLLLSAIFIIIKRLKHLLSVNKLILIEDHFVVSKGYLTKLDSYPITINHLLYDQYLLLSDENCIVYSLYGINIDELINQKVTLYMSQNIIIGFEVNYE